MTVLSGFEYFFYIFSPSLEAVIFLAHGQL
jgi:hypothetical protein